MYEAQKLCDHIELLNEGKIVEYGTPEDICRRYNRQKKILLHLKDGTDMEISHEADSGKVIADFLHHYR